MKKIVIVFILLLGLIFSTGVASASYVWVPYDESESIPSWPGNEYNRAPAAFVLDGSIKLITGGEFCSWWGHGMTGSTWGFDPPAASGLTDLGWRNRPCVYWDGDKLNMIVGERYGGWYGYQYGTVSWSSNSTVKSGIYQSSFYKEPSATVYNDDGTLKLISGNEHGIFIGHYWDGDSWVQDSSIIEGLNNVAGPNTPKVFDQDGTWTLISGSGNGYFYGYYWDDSEWIYDSSIVSGLTDVGTNSDPAIFYQNGKWRLFSGAGVRDMFYWSQEQIFTLSGTVRNAAGTVENVTITLSGSGGSTTSDATGYYEFVDILLDTYSITATEPLHYDYTDSISLTADTEENILLSLLVVPPDIPVVAPPPFIEATTVPIPTPIPTEQQDPITTIIEEIMILISSPFNWILILFAYLGATIGRLISNDDYDEMGNILASVSLYGTLAWILILFINLVVPIITDSGIVSIIIFFLAGFVVSLVMSGKE